MILEELSGGDFLKWDAIMKQPISRIYMKLRINADVSAYNRLINQSISDEHRKKNH